MFSLKLGDYHPPTNKTKQILVFPVVRTFLEKDFKLTGELVKVFGPSNHAT